MLLGGWVLQEVNLTLTGHGTSAADNLNLLYLPPSWQTYMRRSTGTPSVSG